MLYNPPDPRKVIFEAIGSFFVTALPGKFWVKRWFTSGSAKWYYQADSILGCGSLYCHCHCHGMGGLPWTTEFLSCRSGSVGDADPAPEAAPPQAVVFPSGGLLLEGR